MIKTEFKTSTSAYLFSLPDELKLSKNFTLAELANKEGDPAKAQFIVSLYSLSFLELLQKFREKYALPINPTSGHRQPAYNTKIGGDAKSLHLHSCAMDWIEKYRRDPQQIISTWLGVLASAGTIGAVNIYNNSGLYRYHFEAFSNVYLGYQCSRIRVYTDNTQFSTFRSIYTPLGYEVTYHGK